MFSMFFGAGNIIFSLVIGYDIQDKTLFAIAGLLLTAVFVPFAGMIGMILYDGDYARFFGRLGKVPGFLVAVLIMCLLGPLGSTPRCIALSYSTLKTLVPDLSVFLFSGTACVLIYFCTTKKTRVLKLLGYILTPILILALSLIIVFGLINAPEAATTEIPSGAAFLHGLKEGYNTMDLIAAFFFTSIILGSIKKMIDPESKNAGKQLFSIAIKSSGVGAFLLGATYVGFSLIASYHGRNLQFQGNDQLLPALTLKIIGPSAGVMVCLTIALACLTTAIAICTVFAEFLQKTVFNNKISYKSALISTLVLTFFVSTFEFSGISAFLAPILEVCYPVLIALTFLNIYLALRKNKPVPALPLEMTEPEATLDMQS